MRTISIIALVMILGWACNSAGENSRDKNKDSSNNMMTLPKNRSSDRIYDSNNTKKNTDSTKGSADSTDKKRNSTR